MPHTDSADAVLCAERQRQSLSSTDFDEGNSGLRVTASFGVATSQSGDGVDDIVKRCDLALYRAKSEGRDRVVAHLRGKDAT